MLGSSCSPELAKPTHDDRKQVKRILKMPIHEREFFSGIFSTRDYDVNGSVRLEEL